MLIIGLRPKNIESFLRDFNAEHEVTVCCNRLDDASSTRRTATNVTFRVEKGTDPYHRRGFSGRRGVSLCWHGHRDLFRGLFAAYDPDDVGAIEIRTCKARYTSKSQFEQAFIPTGFENIGSQYQPMQYREACDCCDDGRYIG